ncbi:MAG TPA: hypothetical protein VJ464_21700 [Blastocatellia bacterium]|nr:hypothetical protein [Blastocatellia bacterium]
MTLHTPSILDSFTEPAGTRFALAVRPVVAKSLVKALVINIISLILLIGSSG